MPHVIVKLWPGKSDDQKQRLTETITRGVMDTLGYGNERGVGEASAFAVFGKPRQPAETNTTG